MTKSKIIKNFEILATSALRKSALQIAEAGLLAINTQKTFLRSVVYDQASQKLEILGKNFDLSGFNQVILLAFGKAAIDSAAAIQSILKNKLTKGFAIDITARDIPGVQTFLGTHPRPSEANFRAAKEIIDYLKANANEKTLVICAISGGGSALFELPYELSWEEQSRIFDALTKKGATIQELNTVRKHISHVKGGQLAKLIYPSTCLSLVLSDVPGDDLSVIASGCTVKDSTTIRDAQYILNKNEVLQTAQMPEIKLLETPKDDKYFSSVHNFILVSAKTALLAMREKAEELGFGVKIFNDRFQGEAEKLAKEIIFANDKKNQCLLGAGESTVILKGKGLGGRNQHLALASLSSIADNQVLITLASDGHDNSESAGAIVDASTIKRAKNLGLDIHQYLENNDSFTFFEQLGDSLQTGSTGSNVADLLVCITK